MSEEQDMLPVSKPRRRLRPVTRNRSIRLPEVYWTELDRLATERNDSVTRLVRMAVEAHWIGAVTKSSALER